MTATSADALAALRPVVAGGTVTFAGQTHPADGNAGLVVTTPARARELARDGNVRVRLLGFGQARVEQAYMPEAVIPAATDALGMAGLGIGDIEAVKTHNPFAVKRHRVRAHDRLCARAHEQLRLFADLGPPAGADRYPGRSSS